MCFFFVRFIITSWTRRGTRARTTSRSTSTRARSTRSTCSIARNRRPTRSKWRRETAPRLPVPTATANRIPVRFFVAICLIFPSESKALAVPIRARLMFDAEKDATLAKRHERLPKSTLMSSAFHRVIHRRDRPDSFSLAQRSDGIQFSRLEERVGDQ